MINPLFAKVKFKKNHPDAKVPFRAHQGDAGYDLFAVEDINVSLGSVAKIPTGISIELPTHTFAQICDRSSMGLKGLHCFSGIIDSGFKGDMSVIMFNACAVTDSYNHYKIKKGDRIAQLIVKPVYEVEWEESDDLNINASSRKDAGFGSSGR